MPVDERSKPEIALARLNAWWSEWLTALDAFSPDDLEIPGVCGKWSALDLMAHVDGWDIHAALVAERSSAGFPLDVPELRGTNRRSTERYFGFNAVTARAHMERTHAELLERLAALPTIEPKWIAEDTYRHYPDHVDHLLEWRSQRAGARDSAFTNVEIGAAIEREWTIWLDVLDGIPGDAIDERGVCGMWSVKDLIGHVATWDRISIDYCRRRVGNESVDSSVDWEAVNAESARVNRERSLDDLVSDMHAAHHELSHGLLELPALDAEWLADGTYEHYPQHVAQIRAWKHWRLPPKAGHSSIK